MKYPNIHPPPTQSVSGAPPTLGTPTRSNDHFAARLQQNWLTRNPHFEHVTQAVKDPLDDSLTSLNWLHNMNLNIGASTPPISPRTPPVDPNRVNPNQVLPTNLLQPGATTSEARFVLDPAIQFDKINYKTNPYIKPPYSYATLICMTMKESKKAKMTLAQIYSWITEHFLYYKMADPSWQNSIRHNLSLNKCFQKVPRKKEEPGKGGFWRINPEYNALLDSSGLKKRSHSELDSSLKCLIEELDTAPRKRSRSVDDEGNEAALSLNEYLNFDRLLNQDICVEGVKLRTENIIDGATRESSITLSPPMSEDGSTDSFDDLLGAQLSALNTNDAGPSNSNITVQGVKIEPPEWWAESLNGTSFNGLLSSGITSGETESHPWSANKADIDNAMAAFNDMDKFLNCSFN